jgi:hypothetical protein
MRAAQADSERSDASRAAASAAGAVANATKSPSPCVSTPTPPYEEAFVLDLPRACTEKNREVPLFVGSARELPT